MVIMSPAPSTRGRPRNDLTVPGMMIASDIPVVAWGAHGSHPRHQARRDRIAGPDLRCLRTTGDGEPRHPRMLATTTLLVRWNP